MEENNRSSNVLLGALMTAMFAVTGCGGSSGGGTPEVPAATTISGTAAAGAPIIGQVTVKGALGVTKSALIEADGSYNVDVTGLTAPYRLRAEGTVGGRNYKLHSYAEAADVGGNVNITPFTDLIVANAASQIAESYFDSGTPAELDPVVVDAQEEALQAKLQNVFDALGVATAIDLLNSTFSADHSGLDAALDAISIEVDAGTNIATITNLVENTTITDSVVDTTDNTETLVVTDPAAIASSADATVAIAARFTELQTAFAAGLPTQASIEDIFAADFYDEDTPKALWLTDITTDPSIIGLSFSGVVVSDITATTATVTFNFGVNGFIDLEPVVWYAAKDATLGWQLRGDQKIAETYFSYHCNDYDGTDAFPGACGINTQFWDNDFTNNGTVGDAPVASGTVTIIDGTDGVTVKGVVYLGTPPTTAPGDVQVYNEALGDFQGDWKAFGTAAGEIDSSIFVAGDIIQYDMYVEDLDITTPSVPQIAAGAVPVATYTDTLLFAPSTTLKLPVATAATLTAISDFTIGDNLVLAWTLAQGTRNNEVLVMVSDQLGNRMETWIQTLGTTTNSQTVASTALDATAATSAGLDPTAATYELRVRIYAEDEVTGQEHSVDYAANIPGPGVVVTPPPATGLTCGYESGWDDLADGGLGAPITANSFADYESVILDCLGGVVSTFTAADLESTSYVDGGLELITFDALGGAAGTELDPGTGTYDGDGSAASVEPVINFEWWIEDATCAGCTHSYVVIYADDTMNPGVLPAGLWLRETTAITSVTGTPGVSGAIYEMYRYAEQSNYSDADRAAGTDGEIWFSTNNVLQ